MKIFRNEFINFIPPIKGVQHLNIRWQTKINKMIKHYELKKPGELSIFNPNPLLKAPQLYEPSPDLIDAVNVALTLGLPLLLTGEPGTGKTELAKHLAYHFNLGKVLQLDIQTNSSSSDLFYRYDALGHFQYNQNNEVPLKVDEIESRFIYYQALGEAIKAQKRCIVLLDEIDKAPRDLPNDVLNALDELSFFVPEINKRYTSDAIHRPVIIMTSNSEKNLPDAFLRRVAYHHIEFPDAAKLLSIVSAKVPGYDTEQLKFLVKYFEDIRFNTTLKLDKKPATAELIQWVYYLYQANFNPSVLLNNHLDPTEKQILKSSLVILAKTREDLAALYKRLK